MSANGNGDNGNNGNEVISSSFRKRFFWMLGAWTFFMVGVMQVLFWSAAWHIRPLAPLQQEAQEFWLAGLVSYVCILYFSRTLGLSRHKSEVGQWFAYVVIANFPSMFLANLVRNWFFGKPVMNYPEGALQASIEALMLFAASSVLKEYASRKNCTGTDQEKSSSAPAPSAAPVGPKPGE